MSTAYFEDDYRPVVAEAAPGRFLPGAGIEIIRELDPREPPRHVLFDFDGTLSLIREGWMDVMVPMMVEIAGGHGHRRVAPGAGRAGPGVRHGTDRQADDLPDDPSGRGGRASGAARRRSPAATNRCITIG